MDGWMILEMMMISVENEKLFTFHFSEIKKKDKGS
jgi:hypothetical protein